METPVGEVPQVSTSLTWADHWGTIKARWGVGRMKYTIEPGLYALGHPHAQSPVLVTANYKMSFDRLREALPGRDAWILVLDTHGINVWCAAGKGTFGTQELVNRVSSSGLSRVVAHRRLILPQLSGPGVASYKVPKLSGFKVNYGPIRSKDLPDFMDNGFQPTPGMRLKTFDTWERVVLIPVELVSALKWAIVIALLFFFLGGIGDPAGFWTSALRHGLLAAVAVFTALTAGAVLTPLLLPWLPGRAFSLKGLIVGLVAGAIFALFWTGTLGTWQGRLELLSWCFLIPTIAAYLAMNFTGASTYTSLSGVKKEMRWAVPLQVAGGVVGLALWLGSRFMA